MKPENNMVNPKTWQEFRNTGLLLLINSILHAFGWAICLEFDASGNIINCYPARVRFRGFGEQQTTEAHKKIGEYLKENAEQLSKEASE